MKAASVWCPHGYDECIEGCVYPGRCGRFNSTEEIQMKSRGVMEAVEGTNIGDIEIIGGVRLCHPFKFRSQRKNTGHGL